MQPAPTALGAVSWTEGAQCLVVDERADDRVSREFCDQSGQPRELLPGPEAGGGRLGGHGGAPARLVASRTGFVASHACCVGARIVGRLRLLEQSFKLASQIERRRLPGVVRVALDGIGQHAPQAGNPAARDHRELGGFLGGEEPPDGLFHQCLPLNGSRSGS